MLPQQGQTEQCGFPQGLWLRSVILREAKSPSRHSARSAAESQNLFVRAPVACRRQSDTFPAAAGPLPLAAALPRCKIRGTMSRTHRVYTVILREAKSPSRHSARSAAESQNLFVRAPVACRRQSDTFPAAAGPLPLAAALPRCKIRGTMSRTHRVYTVILREAKSPSRHSARSAAESQNLFVRAPVACRRQSDTFPADAGPLPLAAALPRCKIRGTMSRTHRVYTVILREAKSPSRHSARSAAKSQNLHGDSGIMPMLFLADPDWLQIEQTASHCPAKPRGNALAQALEFPIRRRRPSHAAGLAGSAQGGHGHAGWIHPD